MSIDRSLKVKGALDRHRNVLKRAERIEKLKEEEIWSEGDSLLGLPKVAHRKSHAGRKEAKEEVLQEGIEAVEGAEGTEAQTGTAETPKAEKES
ncbi:MAG: small basic protein [Planctomycetes bacterium]|nr:small basic protein [Planctomycetota bacterium]